METDLKGQHSFILFYFVYVVDPATFLASNSVLGTLFPAYLFSCGKKKYFGDCVFISLMLM